MVRTTEHTCKDCNKIYASYQSLCNHRTKFHKLINNSIEQHTPQPITALNNIHFVEFNCRKCNKSYKHQQSRSRHEIKCDKNQEIIEKNNSQIIQNPNNNSQLIENQNNGTINTTNNTNNGTINNTTNITINNYGQENKSYISEGFMLSVISHIVNSDEKINNTMPNVFRNIHLNSKHKDNNNIKINNMRSEIAKVYKNGKWVYSDKNKILTETHDKSVKFTEDWIEENEDKVPKNAKNKLKDYTQSHFKKYKNKKEIFDEMTKLAYIYYKNYMEEKDEIELDC